MLTQGEGKVVDSVSEIAAVGHRIVQGGAIFSQSVLVTDKVIDQIEGLAPLAPVHNLGAARALRACRKVFGENVPMVTVFDTAFHKTMPPKAGMRIMSSIPSGNTASTAPPTGLSRQTLPNGSASPWKS